MLGNVTPDACSELLKGETEGLLKLPTDKALVKDPEFRRYIEIYAKVHNNSVASSVNDQTAPERETIAFCEPELVNQNIYHVSSDAFSILFTSEFSTPWIHRISTTRSTRICAKAKDLHCLTNELIRTSQN